MLSHLRFHRRAPSNPTSPLPDQTPPSWEAAALHEHPQTVQDVSPRPDTRPRSANASQMPPTLPPIARVTSANSDISFPPHDDARPVSQDSRTAPTRPANEHSNTTSFMGGMTLHNFRRSTLEPQRPEFAGTLPSSQPQLPDSHISRAKAPPPPINTGAPTARPALAVNNKQSKSTSFVAPTDIHQSSGAATGKRPAGTRLATEPVAVLGSSAASETHKGKKGLPFLKNPMSTLLMRRRTGHNAPDVQPLPVPVEPSYDPRIRGTKVHDFSAPRPRRGMSGTDAVARSITQPGLTPSPAAQQEKPQVLADFDDKSIPLQHPPRRDSRLPPPPGLVQTLDVNHAILYRQPDSDLGSKSQETIGVALSRTSTDQSVPQVPPKDVPPSARTPSSATSRTSRETSVRQSSASVRTTRSRNFSLSEVSTRDSVMSAVPKHMKSTSSRFSFDMIGAASQEKLLEERHRQREQEKKTDDIPGHRDSRFDEFDDDGFDYDAMMDDDGLEERIPGVNADLEDEDDFDPAGDPAEDPDDDQENFAGFVFQRSNPPSSLASPHSPAMLATPRDAHGKVIGFAMTKDTTPDLPSSASPIFAHNPAAAVQMDDTPVAGLGINGLDVSTEPVLDEPIFRPSYEPALFNPPASERVVGDDLYFDDGLADELAFPYDGTVFDESIFDMNDTDRYGRPIPGAFAQAKEAMQAAQQQPSKPESDIASRLSGQSAVSESTAHTSLSAGLQQLSVTVDKELGAPSPPKQPASDDTEASAIAGQDMAYQAALAEAAQKAAASGKFRRSSSPPLPAELTITSPTDSSESLVNSHLDEELDNYEDDPFASNLDDYEFDDDAIIAEANASVLASDSDGFYGQEFGFYSAPAPQPHHSQNHHLASTPGPSAALSAENLYQYANGGYFGPAGQGVNRSTSGRVVSREPNLTPITERSEYSNRNSIMSLALPPALGSDGGRNSIGLQSPGLAQLALLSDDDNMNLSALMKLRSRAWGGSQPSLVGSREGSPRSERAMPGGEGTSSPYTGAESGVLGPPANIIAGLGHSRKNSAFSIWSNSDAGGSGPASPTLTMQMTLPMSSPPVPGLPASAGISSPSAQSLPPLHSSSPPSSMAHNPSSPPAQQPTANAYSCSPVLEGEEADPDQHLVAGDLPMPSASPELERVVHSPAQMDQSNSNSQQGESQARRPSLLLGHRHKGSADSISYIKEEEDASGTTRWVMERRRTAETGEVEILERELVEGGRI